jgi:hypothetical protein
LTASQGTSYNQVYTTLIVTTPGKVSIPERHITDIRLEEEIEMLKLLLSVCVDLSTCKNSCNDKVNSLIIDFLWGMESSNIKIIRN